MKTITYDQPSSAPTPKVAAAGIGGALSVILIYLVRVLLNTELPAEVAASVATVLAFGAGYLKKDERPVEVVETIKKEK